MGDDQTTKAEKRFRRYTDFDSILGDRRSRLSGLRRRIVWDFTEELSKRLNAEDEQGRLHVPLVAPVVGIGFSSNVRRRLQDH